MSLERLGRGQGETGFPELLTVGKVVNCGLQYAGYGLAAVLLLFLLRGGQWKRLCALALYLLCFLSVDALSRPYVLYRFGLASHQYGYFYWITDVLLGLAAFLLVCAFFRRACSQEAKMWGFVRLVLLFVFLLVLGVSAFSLSRNLTHLFTRFIIEFQQNLYFTCLVLNTLLYILMQQLSSADDELGLLVCGMGIQLAGPAATLALVHLTPGQRFAEQMLKVIGPVCYSGMLLVWFYAVARMPKAAPVSARSRKVAAPLAEAVVSSEG